MDIKVASAMFSGFAALALVSASGGAAANSREGMHRREFRRDISDVQGAAFDLVCSGQSTMSDVDGFSIKPFGASSPFVQRFRIDLASRRWCEGECQVTKSLSEVTDTVIIFEQSQSKTGGFDHGRGVSRESGRYIDRTKISNDKDNGTIIMVEASCVRYPFSGFPKKLF